MQTWSLICGDLQWEFERGNVVLCVVSLVDQNGNLATSSPSTLQLKFISPVGTTIGPFTLAGSQVVAGSGPQGGSNSPLGSFSYALDTSQSTNRLTGAWKGTWSSTGPVAQASFGFQVVDTYAP